LRTVKRERAEPVEHTVDHNPSLLPIYSHLQEELELEHRYQSLQQKLAGALGGATEP
jgi:hypothetical protein